MKKQGFTLIEISIVVVIIGLIIAGIMVGQSILRSSQLRAITSEAAYYTQAISTFRDKYNALPGDYAAASTAWSGLTNGDGNDTITTNISNIRLDEQFLAWQHLAKSEIIKGNFTGVAGPAGPRDRIPGENIPLSSSISQSGWGLISVTLTDIAGYYSEIPYTAPEIPPNHVLWFGGRSPSGTLDRMTPLLTPVEARDIDIKIDDGWPFSGKVIVQTHNPATNRCHLSARYVSSSSGKDLISCSLVFKTGY